MGIITTILCKKFLAMTSNCLQQQHTMPISILAIFQILKGNLERILLYDKGESYHHLVEKPNS